MKIGIGYDVHRLVEGRKLIIGGVDIPYDKGLDGHSDADVLLHAIADSILGAAKIGDIGKLFPDTDPQFKDADSLILLSKVGDLVKSKNFIIEDIDSIIIAQEPKMSKYRDQMRANIANALNIDVDCVGVKATTTEKLGFEGQGKGIAAHAVTLLRK